jgi:hypothetical protein
MLGTILSVIVIGQTLTNKLVSKRPKFHIQLTCHVIAPTIKVNTMTILTENLQFHEYIFQLTKVRDYFYQTI